MMDIEANGSKLFTVTDDGETIIHDKNLSKKIKEMKDENGNEINFKDEDCG